MKLLFIAAITMSTLLFSCSKNEKDTPGPDPEEKVLLLESVVETTAANKATTTYQYNSSGQMIGETFANTASSSLYLNYNGTVEYDNTGKVTKRLMGGDYGTISFYYNADGKPGGWVQQYPSGSAIRRVYTYYADRYVTENFNTSNAITSTWVDYYNSDKTGIALSRTYNAVQVLLSETRYTYDGKIRKMQPLNSTLPFVSKFNTLKAETKDANGKITATSEYENTYNADGYIEKSINTYKTYTDYPTPKSTAITERIYIYRK